MCIRMQTGCTLNGLIAWLRLNRRTDHAVKNLKFKTFFTMSYNIVCRCISVQKNRQDYLVKRGNPPLLAGWMGREACWSSLKVFLPFGRPLAPPSLFVGWAGGYTIMFSPPPKNYVFRIRSMACHNFLGGS